MKTNIISEISRNYSQALLDTAIESNSVELFSSQLNNILEVFNSSQDLKVVMANSSISNLKKLEVIDSIFKDKIDRKLLNFLKILVEKNRFNEIESIKIAYEESVNKLTNKKTVEVVSPIELNFENKSNVLFKLEKKLNCEISPIWTVDENLIAGLVFKFDDYIIDTSIRAKLEDLSKTLNR